MTAVFEFPAPEKLAARHCITVEEQFGNNDCLSDALVLNLDAVRALREAIPFNPRRVKSVHGFSDIEKLLLGNLAIALINEIEDYMVEPVEE